MQRAEGCKYKFALNTTAVRILQVLESKTFIVSHSLIIIRPFIFRPLRYSEKLIRPLIVIWRKSCRGCCSYFLASPKMLADSPQSENLTTPTLGSPYLTLSCTFTQKPGVFESLDFFFDLFIFFVYYFF